jgi:hypothetical protein
MSADGRLQDNFELVSAGEELVRARDRLSVSLTALEHEITRRFDWQDWVRRRPAMTLAVAFGLGFFLGQRR